MQMQHGGTAQSKQGLSPCCARRDFLLAEKFGLATALVDVHANLHLVSHSAVQILDDHPALLRSQKRIGLLSSAKSSEFRIALRYVISGQPTQTLRVDDGCMGAPLALQISGWHCTSHCLVSFQLLEPAKIDVSHLSNPFGLSPRQQELLELFSEGLSLAEIADAVKLKPQTIREAFCELYARFELRNQLELMAALRTPAMANSCGALEQGSPKA